MNIDRMGVDFGAYHAAACLACLPPGSALYALIDERTSWTTTDFLLHGIAQMLAGKELPYPWDKRKTGLDGIETESMPVDEFCEWYGHNNWKEVDGWQVIQ